MWRLTLINGVALPLILQYKTGKTLAFKPLSQALSDPGEFLLSDFSKVGVCMAQCLSSCCGCGFESK